MLKAPKETKNLARARVSYPLIHELINRLPKVVGLSPSEVICYQRALKMICLSSERYKREIRLGNDKFLNGMFIFSRTTQGSDFWRQLSSKLNANDRVPF